MRVGVIGAGPAGITAALQAARAGAQVLLFDGNDHPGRKLLVTGAGRCNITNAAAGDAARYHTGSPEGLAQALAGFGHTHLLAWLEHLGVPTWSTSDGWFYPLSNSAAGVTALLAARLEETGVEMHLAAEIKDITPAAGGFVLQEANPGRRHTVERVVAACGGRAAPDLGSRGRLFPVLERLGHSILPVLPALAPLTTEAAPFAALQGVRLDAGVQLLEGDCLLGEATGNIIFTAWGLNGPGVMDLSHWVSRHFHRQPAGRPQPLNLRLNFFPGQEPVLEHLLDVNHSTGMPLGALLGAVLPPKLAQWLLAQAGLPPQTRLGKAPAAALERLRQQVTATPVKVTGTRGFDFCQLSCGGVPLEEVDARTMQSARVPGLYLAGEVLDVNGPCGGFNLQWTFTSGWLAGSAAGAD